MNTIDYTTLWGIIMLVFIIVAALLILLVAYLKNKQPKSTFTPLVDRSIYEDMLLSFQYRSLDEVYTYHILPDSRTKTKLKGHCVESHRTIIFHIDNIVRFLHDSDHLFYDLPVSVEEQQDFSLPTRTEQKDKGHDQWDENNRVEIFFQYRNGAGELKDRVVRLINHDDEYGEKGFTGYCKMAEGLRTFLPSRIQTYYKDSRERLERFFKDPHFNRDQLTLSFIGFGEMEMEGYRYLGEQYNFRALKSITVNTDIVVTNRKLSELTDTQQKRIEENNYPIISSKGLEYLLETGEVSEEI